MWVIILSFLSVWVLLNLFSRHSQTVLHKCYATSCGHNEQYKCNLKSIDVYDNRVTGLCLWHTGSMSDRFEQIVLVGIKIGKLSGELEALSSIQEISDRCKLMKNDKDWEDFCRKHGLI